MSSSIAARVAAGVFAVSARLVAMAAIAVMAAMASPALAQPAPERTCHAQNGARVIDLTLTWKTVNTATGELRIDGAAQPVIAELYKGLVLVDAPGTRNVTGQVATVTTEGQRTIRLGDSRQPTFDCK